MAEPLKLPGSSYEELAKIIAGYSNVPGEIGATELGKLVGVDQTTISRNNGFLVAIGILDEAKSAKKQATNIGRDLGLALEHDLSDQVQETWRQIVLANDFMRQLVSAVRIRRGMDTASFLSHVGYSAGLPRARRTSLGGRTVLSILVVAGVVQSSDGKIVAVTQAEESPQDSFADRTRLKAVSADGPVVQRALPSQANALPDAPQIVVNVNIAVDAASLDGLGARLRRELSVLARDEPLEEPAQSNADD